ncbi:MAG: J domain-containing protein [Lachnospiraceae bacterium]|nr:J domain-containing protein [Lachnospiraceae bacterium]
MDIAQNISVEDMASIKLWLLQESQRLEYARRSFEKEKSEFEEKKQQFEDERRIVMASVQEQARKTELEAKNLATEKILFNQKLEILEGGFRSLCKEREEFETEKEKYRGRFAASGSGHLGSSVNVSAYQAGVFFNGVDNVLALKKRYRDLLKIFHPDNMDGDNETVQVINEEYAKLKEQF